MSFLRRYMCVFHFTAHGCYDRVMCMRKHSRIVRRIDVIWCISNITSNWIGRREVVASRCYSSHVLNFRGGTFVCAVWVQSTRWYSYVCTIKYFCRCHSICVLAGMCGSCGRFDCQMATDALQFATFRKLTKRDANTHTPWRDSGG